MNVTDIAGNGSERLHDEEITFNLSLSNFNADNFSMPSVSLVSMTLPQPLLTILIVLYTVVILLAAMGSILVIFAVARSPALRTVSNCYIVNLAVSDLLLATLACPITLTQLTSINWTLPLSQMLCSLSYFFPLFFSFTSAFTITVIALDRHQLIVHTAVPQDRGKLAALVVCGVWLAGLICAAPILPNTRLDVRTIPPEFSSVLGINHRAYCKEEWDLQNGRLMYSLIVLGVQLLLPSLILIIAHASIYRKLSSLPFWNQRRNRQQQEIPMQPKGQNQVENAATHCDGQLPNATLHVQLNRQHRAMSTTGGQNRGNRTLYLLVCVVVVFVVSWLPLNTLNLLLDLGLGDRIFGTDNNSGVNFRTAFSVCHLLGMSSALSNPLVYGFFNQGFRAEFTKILCPWRKQRPENV